MIFIPISVGFVPLIKYSCHTTRGSLIKIHISIPNRFVKYCKILLIIVIVKKGNALGSVSGAIGCQAHQIIVSSFDKCNRFGISI